MQSPGGGGGRVGGEAGDIRGRHRIQAELKKLEQEARFLEVRLSLLLFFCHLLSLKLLPEVLKAFDNVFFIKLEKQSRRKHLAFQPNGLRM
jgi:hypothetical protein